MNNLSYTQMRILETARSFDKLCKIYRKRNINRAACVQLEETARVLEEVAGIENETELSYEFKGKKLQRRLLQYGIKLQNVRFFRKKDGKLSVSVYAHSKSGCIKASELALIVGDIIDINLVPTKGSRLIVSGHPAEFMFEEAPVYFALFGNAGISKEAGDVSGDSFTFAEGDAGRIVMGLSDGMGTGTEAEKKSSLAMELVEEFTEAGFTESRMVEMINGALASEENGAPVTIDLAAVNLMDGLCTFIKLGAAATFVKCSDNVKIIKPSSLPAGVLDNVEPDISGLKLHDGEYVILVSDGVVDALPFYDKEQHLARIIDEIKCLNPQKMADKILEECRYYRGNEHRDDMTVLVMGIWRIKDLQT